MGIGDNTRQIIIGRLAQSQDLSEIEYCQELWIQTHGYKSIYFIGLTSQLAFDRNAYFIQAPDNQITSEIKNRLTSEALLPLRRAIIMQDMSISQSLFSGLGLHIFYVYGPHQAVGLFLLAPIKNTPLGADDRLNISQDLYVFQQALFSQYFSRVKAPIKLTAREAEVLSWVAQGKSNLVIAKILGVSPHTVDNFLRRAFKKIGVNSRTSAITKALALGLIYI